MEDLLLEGTVPAAVLKTDSRRFRPLQRRQEKSELLSKRLSAYPIRKSPSSRSIPNLAPPTAKLAVTYQKFE
jgi:hypothetical protein